MDKSLLQKGKPCNSLKVCDCLKVGHSSRCVFYCIGVNIFCHTLLSLDKSGHGIVQLKNAVNKLLVTLFGPLIVRNQKLIQVHVHCIQ